MKRAETDEGIPDSAAEMDAREDKRERRLYWRRIRRRFLGAAAVFLLIGMLWQLGDDSRPPRIHPASPSAEPFPELSPNSELQNAEDALAAADEIAPALDEESEPAVELSLAEELGGGVVKTEAANDAQVFSPSAEPVLTIEETPALAEDKKVAAVEESDAKESVVEESAAKESVAEESVAAEEKVATSEKESSSPQIPATDESFFVLSSELTGFAVQVGAFGKRAYALRLARKLRKEGFVIQISEWKVGGEIWWRVRAAGYKTRPEAELARRDLVALRYTEAVVRDQQ